MNFIKKTFTPVQQMFAATAIFAMVFLSAQGIFSPSIAHAAAGASIEQCRNGKIDSPVDCVDGAWVSGNAGAQNSHYVEGQSIPYRTVMIDVPTDVPTVLTLKYAVKKGGHHAIDYLTSYDRIPESVDPVNDIAGIVGGESTFAIPAPSSIGSPVVNQPTASFNALAASERLMSVWNASISDIKYISEGDLTVNNSDTIVEVTFQASQPTVVLAWGGHIGSRLDWGLDVDSEPLSAGGISGSSYHMAIDDWNHGNLGNQDRSLSAAAVIPPGNLTVIKEVVNDNGGDAVSSDFVIDVSASTSADPTQFQGDANGTPVTIVVGDNPTSYTVTETIDPAYDVMYSDDCDSTIDSGEQKTCTITNDDKAPSLTLTKVVNNSAGGSEVASSWEVEATGPTTISGNGSAVSGASFDAGTYTLSESDGPTLAYEGSYMAGQWSCTNDVSVNGNNEITLGLGESTECTITNTFVPPDKASLTVFKTVENNYGGTAATSTFQYFVTSFLDEATEVFHNVLNMFDPGTYTVSETGLPSGYEASDWGTDCDADGSIDMVKDGNYTCTITNSDTPASITVHKVVENGTSKNPKASDEFDIQFDATDINETNATTTTFAGDDAGTVLTFDAGSYKVTEPSHDGYTVEFEGDCDGTAALGEDDLVCTVTNTYIEPTETIINFYKVVNNNYGGTATSSDFTFDVTGSSTHNGVLHAGQIVVGLGSYNVSEDGPDGYELDSYSNFCSGGTFDIEQGDLGEEYDCTITNNDIQPKLTVIKNVVNDNQYQAGTAVASEFTMNVTGTNVSSTTFSGDETGVMVTLDAGTYSVTEDFAQGYGVSYSADCDSDANGEIKIGEERTCTITNNDLDPTTAVVNFYKTVNNNYGGTATSSAFTFEVSGGISTTSVDHAGSLELGLGTYDVTESTLYGYEFVENNDFCAGGDFEITGTELGQSFDCYFTNQDIQPKLTVTKVVNGGDGEVSDFVLAVGSTTVTSGEENGFDAGSYDISETFDPEFENYIADYSGACSSDGQVTLEVGDVKECTITNSAYTVTGFKWHDLTDFETERPNGIFDQNEKRLADWEIIATQGDEIISTTTSDSGYYKLALGPGSWTISEVLQGGWIQTYPDPEGDDEGNCYVTFNEQTEDFDRECNFGNHLERQPALSCDVFTASPNSNVSSGGNVTLEWETTDAHWVSIDQGVGDDLAKDGTTVVNPVSDTLYTLTARRAIGDVTSFEFNQAQDEYKYDEVTCQTLVDIDTGGGGGGSSSPRCDAFDLSGDTLSWETHRGYDLEITENGTEIFSTTDDDVVDEGSFDISAVAGATYELTVNRGSKDDTCTINLDGPDGEVAGDQVTRLPEVLGVATGAGGAASAVPFANTFAFFGLLLSLGAVRATRNA